MSISYESDPYDAKEIILKEDPHRFVLFPIKYHDVWDMFKRDQAQHWVAEDIDFSTDRADWDSKLSEAQKHFMFLVISFFAASDGIVMENIGSNFASEIQVPEMRHFYAQQSYREAIHSETYSLMIDSLESDPQKKREMFDAVTNNPSVKKLAKWAQKWMDPQKYPFRVRIVAFILYEGFVFSGKFASVFWFKKQNLLQGVCDANQFIARDEGLHESFGILVHSKLQKKCEPEMAHSMLKEIYKIDCEFFQDALQDKMVGINYNMMTEYLKGVGNRIMIRLDMGPVFENASRNMLTDMMDKIGVENKVSFFEKRNHVYHQANVMSENTNDMFGFDGDF
jgi:ribonucleotide reductase beta subunit family protein with ferritin-like domain